VPLRAVYGPEDLAGWEPARDLGQPGEFPYTRGIHPRMYRDRLWTMRLYAGYGAGEDANERFKFLLANGQTGLSVALDLPTQMGLDSDDPRALGEVGRVGVAIDTLEDVAALFDGIPLDKISVSFTVNACANVVLALYVALAERQGVPPDALRGTLQNDVLKEYLARGTYIFPPQPSLALIGDTIEYCLTRAPKFNPVNAASAHIRSSGARYPDAMACMFLSALEYVRAGMARGYGAERVAPLMSFLVSADRDLFESVARFRAARRLWAHLVRDRLGAREPRAQHFRVFAGGDILNMAVDEPLNNIARIALQALANALGGVQSMTLPSYDEAYALPTEESALVSLRVQQIVAHESGATAVVDPLAGSYFVEWLTGEMERRIRDRMAEIEARGGIVRSIEDGWLQREISRQAYERERRVERGQEPLVGETLHRREGTDRSYEQQMFTLDPGVVERQLARLRRVRETRDAGAVAAALGALREAARDGANTLPPLVRCAHALATVGEMIGVLREVHGTFRPPAVV
jgi:methylmalonyl-CoA mutase N-terminal domain/subunit